MTAPLPSYPTLRRFDVLVLRDASATDNAQVWASAQVDFYQQGATVQVGATIAVGATVAVHVFHTGTITGGTVRLDAASTVLQVDGAIVGNDIPLKNTTGASVTVSAGQRLLPLANRPIARMDPNGTLVESGSSIQTQTNDAYGGRARCYIKEPLFDYVVKILNFPGSPPPDRVYPDALGSYIHR